MMWLSHFQQTLKSPIGFSCRHCTKPSRCCDFTPFFPNFLAGKALSENSHQFDQFEEFRFHPLGVFPPDFRLPNRVCDFFEAQTASCTNWSNRPSECSSYFCGDQFTKISETLSNSLFKVELQVAQMSLKGLGFSVNQIEGFVDEWNRWIEGQSPLEKGQRFTKEACKAIYLGCWAEVKKLSWSELTKRLSTIEVMEFEKNHIVV